MREVAELTHWSATAVRNAVLRQGWHMRPRSVANRKKQLDPKIVEEMVELYESGLSMKEVAEKMGTTYSTIQWRLKHVAGVKARPQGRNIHPRPRESYMRASRARWSQPGS